MKGSFCGDLQDAVDGAPSGDILIVARGWNARPGLANMARWHMLGYFVLGSRCANGDHLVNCVLANRLVVSSTHTATL